ncbi:MAG: hypothetical protein EOP11_04260 [Proteobacteria bacterium]|nr:MAG: hypothetical protein EOP11_04260 [Pseudomonadota bacterium]
MADSKKSSIGGKTTCHLVNIKHPDRVAKRMKLSFARTRASITVLKADRTVEASISFMDLSESGTGLFTSELLLKGSTVELCITEPHLLRVRAVVAWSIPKASGLNVQAYGFRSGLQFVCENEVQRVAIAEFIRKVNTDPIEAMRSSANATPATGGAIEIPAEAPVAPVGEAAPPAEGEALAAEASAASEASAEAPAASEEEAPVAAAEDELSQAA